MKNIKTLAWPNEARKTQQVAAPVPKPACKARPKRHQKLQSDSLLEVQLDGSLRQSGSPLMQGQQALSLSLNRLSRPVKG